MSADITGANEASLALGVAVTVAKALSARAARGAIRGAAITAAVTRAAPARSTCRSAAGGLLTEVHGGVDAVLSADITGTDEASLALGVAVTIAKALGARAARRAIGGVAVAAAVARAPARGSAQELNVKSVAPRVVPIAINYDVVGLTCVKGVLDTRPVVCAVGVIVVTAEIGGRLFTAVAYIENSVKGAPAG